MEGKLELFIQEQSSLLSAFDQPLDHVNKVDKEVQGFLSQDNCSCKQYLMQKWPDPLLLYNHNIFKWSLSHS